MATSKTPKATAAPTSSTEKAEEKKVEDVASKIKTESKGVINSASKIVFKAVNILEEEIAKGIVAARQVEDKLIDVPKLRNPSLKINSTQSEELLSRFRKDVHDIIDLFIDFTTIAVNSVEKISSNLISIKQENGTTTTKPAQQTHIPLIQVPQEIKPGESLEIPVKLENDDKNNPKSLFFTATPLTNENGNTLAASALSFSPNPLAIEPNTSGIVNVKIVVPASAKTGSYTSFVQAKDLDNVKATLLVKIV
jgi:hypothetical protein